ncbi:MAG: hypothetical protein KDA85_04595 [Planctomycetaceae bacterium]|nr:hypothetical protein [Planctomycetaceae bacterium]
MSIKVSCGECGKAYQVSDDRAGRKFKCKQCGAIVEVPADDAYGGTDDGAYGGYAYGAADPYTQTAYPSAPPAGTPYATAAPAQYNQPSPVSDGMKIGIGIVSFFVPLVGLIIGLIYLNDAHPDKKKAGKLWLTISGITIGLNFLCCCVYMIIVGVVGAGAGR